MSRINSIQLRRSLTPADVPLPSDLLDGELVLNLVDGNLYTKQVVLSAGQIISQNTISFNNSDNLPYSINKSLSSINYAYGQNTNTGIHSYILGGINNNNSAIGSAIISGESNTLSAVAFGLIGTGLNNFITSAGDFGVILGGENNTITHANTFVLGSNITTSKENYTYVNNISVVESFEMGSGNTVLYVSEGERVGINTENPTEALTVMGNISASGNLYVSHKSTHAIDGSDTLTPVDIGAQSIFKTVGFTAVEDTTLSAGRAVKYGILNFTGSAINITLPTENVLAGDVVIISSPVMTSGSSLVIRKQNVNLSYVYLATITGSIPGPGETFRFFNLGTSGQDWNIDVVPNHGGSHGLGASDPISLDISQITDLQSTLNSKVLKSGDTMTGTLTVMGNISASGSVFIKNLSVSGSLSSSGDLHISHKSTHATGGTDALTPSDIGAQPVGSYATLVGGFVPASQLPSYVDDVLEYADLAAFPELGESGKIFVAKDTRKVYRWAASAIPNELVVSGAGSGNINGNYVRGADFAGRAAWYKAEAADIKYINGQWWFVPPGGAGAISYYYSIATDSVTPENLVFVSGTLGAAPVPSVTAVPSGSYIEISPSEVTSVNTKTGAVVITASEVGAVAKSGDTMTGKLTLSASTIASAPFKILHGLDPSPTTTELSAAGDIWLNQTIRYRDQTGTIRFVADTNRPNNFTQRQTIVADSFTTLPALRITQEGTGNALVIEDETNPDNNPFIIDNKGSVGIGLSSLSGIDAKLTVVGSISSTGVVYASGGNSDQWNSTFTTVQSTSANWEGMVDSNITGIAGATSLTNMMQITLTGYNAITPAANTLYIIVG